MPSSIVRVIRSYICHYGELLNVLNAQLLALLLVVTTTTTKIICHEINNETATPNYLNIDICFICYTLSIKYIIYSVQIKVTGITSQDDVS